MRKNISLLIFITAILFVLGNVNAGVPADMEKEIQMPFNPKKKKVGEVCEASDECQKHHECKNKGGKNICTAPPQKKLPPGAVT